MSTTSATPPPVGLWSVLPGSLRVALVVALTTSVAAGALLFSSDLGTGPSAITQDDGAGNPVLGSGTLGLSPTPTPTPIVSKPRSAAVITVPRSKQGTEGERQGRFPTFGRYVFTVEGSEQGGALTQRDVPPEMTMTVDREVPDEGGIPPLDDNELVFSLDYGPEHQEREIVSYTAEGMAFTYESIDITVGPSTFGGETTFDPQVLQIPAVLDEGTSTSGTSSVFDGDGSQARVEDWRADVEGREQIEIRGETVDAWVVTLERRSQAGTDEPFTRTRKYWFDPQSGVWVKFEETTQMREGSGIGAMTYSSNLTATLSRVEPL